jgi:hypothetical protein
VAIGFVFWGIGEKCFLALFSSVFFSDVLVRMTLDECVCVCVCVQQKMIMSFFMEQKEWDCSQWVCFRGYWGKWLGILVSRVIFLSVFFAAFSIRNTRIYVCIDLWSNRRGSYLIFLSARRAGGKSVRGPH